MLKAAESRQAAILQRQETRQINNSKKRISSAKQATSMWQDSVDLESQAIKDILDKYAFFSFEVMMIPVNAWKLSLLPHSVQSLIYPFRMLMFDYTQ